MNVYELAPRFMALFSGLDTAFGTGAGRWIKRPPTVEDFVIHLSGEGPGIGIAPLRPDSKVKFAAIDLDEPFDESYPIAQAMQEFIPGSSWVERTRSGNIHVWVFFQEPIDAWVPMGILRETCKAVGTPLVEVFPKNHDFSRVKLGNYVNLPYHGKDRFVVDFVESQKDKDKLWQRELDLVNFIAAAESSLQDCAVWERRADWLQLTSPGSRTSNTEFGKQPNLHICGEHIIEHAADNPIVEGHRAAVYFALAKMLSNWDQVDSDEALELMQNVNQASPDPVSDAELRRILGNAERGQYTSFGCDDPLVQPYTHPNCKIANGR